MVVSLTVVRSERRCAFKANGDAHMYSNVIGWLTSACVSAEKHGRRLVEQSKHPLPQRRLERPCTFQLRDRYEPPLGY